jgi:dihydrodiol dehydrogenase / D-xylose 1-dehydrogenase (NADP)
VVAQQTVKVCNGREGNSVNRPVRWGILGTGNIARKFACGLRLARDSELVAVGSRSAQTASAFAREFGVARAHGSYEALMDDDVDVVYVATPHPMHLDNMLLCLRAGKAVLCEKPFTLNEAEARQAIALARRQKLFLMEALWTRFLPPVIRLRQMLAKGVLGELRFVSADFGFCATYEPEGRLFNPDLGGGCLLDIGVYPISLATMALGQPTVVTGSAHIGQTGVDEQAAVTLGYRGGALASLYASFHADTPNEAVLIGTEGRVRLHRHWWKGGPLTRTVGGRSRQIDVPILGNGYQYEAEEVARCLREGRLESDGMPLEQTLMVMQTLDRLRASWGLCYPMEPQR